MSSSMYRTVARRLLPALCHRSCYTRALVSTFPLRSYSSATSETVESQKPQQFGSTAAPLWAEEERARQQRSESSSSRTGRDRAQYQEEQARVLNASLRHVPRLGWTEAAMVAGAREVGVSPSIVGSFPRKEAALVEFFMDESLQSLIDYIDSSDDLKDLIPSALVANLVRTRLEMQAPYISKWAQALSIQAHPLNISTSFKQRAMLVDEIWHAAGDNSADVDWYVKRTVLGGIYSAAELYMLTDNSPDFRDSWAFLERQVKDAFDLRKTAQEAKYLAEAVSQGMGGSFEGFVKRVFQG